MLQLLRPCDVRNVDQAIDTILDLDKCPKIRQISNLTVDFRSYGITRSDRVPRIIKELFQSEANAFLDRIDAEYLHFDLVAAIEHAFRAYGTLRPRNLRDVNQSFNAGLKLDKHTVIGNGRNSALYPRIHRIHLDHG